MTAERALRDEVLIATSAIGTRLFRNNVGLGWLGRMVSRGDRMTVIADARPLHAGLCTGSSDLIGWTPVVITPEMVGQTMAVFTAIELKTGRQRATAEQAAFLVAVQSVGGIAGVARTVAEAAELCRLASTPMARAPDNTICRPLRA